VDDNQQVKKKENFEQDEDKADSVQKDCH
jgi:hypothetical protein